MAGMDAHDYAGIGERLERVEIIICVIFINYHLNFEFVNLFS